MKNSRNAALDLIRGASILYIVGYWHLFNYTGALPKYYNFVTCRLTVIVLGLFVLISGYLSGMKAGINSRHDIVAFYKARLLRVYPPFIVAILFYAFLGLAEYSTLLKSAALVSVFLPPPPPTLWFIVMLVSYYLLVPLLIHMSSSIRRYAVFCLLLFAATVALANFHKGMDTRFAIYLPVFASGVLMARHPVLRQKTSIAAVAGLFVLSAVFSFNRADNVELSLSSIPLVFSGSLLVYLILMRYEKHIRHIKVIELVSCASLFMYLFHRPVFVVMRKLYFPASGMWQVIYLGVVCVPLIAVISIMAQKGYDRLISRVGGD